jgi:predicted DNA binding CopG/RHH family protein
VPKSYQDPYQKDKVRLPAFTTREIRNKLKQQAMKHDLTFQEYITEILGWVAKTGSFDRKKLIS